MAKENSDRTLRIGNVLITCWTVFRTNFVLLAVLAFIVDFLTNRLVQDVMLYTRDVWRVENSFTDSEYWLLVAELTEIYLSVVLMQVIATELTRGRFNQGSQSNERKEIIESFRSAEFILDSIRAVGIFLVIFVFYFLAIFLSLLIGVASGLVWLSGILLFAVALLLPRFLLAVPITVVTNQSVMDSLFGSYQMTAQCWMKIYIVNILAGLVLAPSIIILTFMDDQLWWFRVGTFLDIVGYALVAIAMPVCYFYLRNAEAADRIV